MITQHFKIVVAIFIAALVTPLIAILTMNNGTFVYSLDDPFIHLALAENLINGHYGVNTSEYSSPSSSVLWPFLLAPIQLFDHSGLSPLLINLVCALCTYLIVIRQIFAWYHDDLKAASVLSILFIICTNIVGVAYTGMEHSLQILMSVLALRGAIIVSEGEEFPMWLPVVLAIGPLLRYENISLSAAVGLYAIYKGHWKPIVIAGVATILLLVAHALFLKSLDLNYFSSSISVKSTTVADNGSMASVFDHVIQNLLSPGGYTHIILMIFLALAVKKKTAPIEQRVISACLFLGSLLHLLGGRYGWFARYELYIFMPVLLWVLFIHKERVKSFISHPVKHYWMSLYLLTSLLPYLYFTVATPIASHNIYSQQYQMHRFVTEYFQKPVAVNDLGWVSYGNDQYVLDLWGLASIEAFEAKRDAINADWMNDLTDKHGIDLAMIYHNDRWFKDVPADWTLLGHQRLKDEFILIDREVSFYATNNETVNETLDKVVQFSSSLPTSTEFIRAESFGLPDNSVQ